MMPEHDYVIQSNLYKTTTLGTTQKWSSWTGGRLMKPNLVVLGRFLVFIPSVNVLRTKICWNKDLQFRVFW